MTHLGARTFVEVPVNPLNPEHARPDSLFGANNKRWNQALSKLGLVVTAPYPALSTRGGRLPNIRAALYDEALLDAGQYANLSMVSRDSSRGLGVHMVNGMREYLDDYCPGIAPGVQPHALTVHDVFADIARVTIGEEQRHADIDPAFFEPMIQVCRDIGTIGLLEQTRTPA